MKTAFLALVAVVALGSISFASESARSSGQKHSAGHPKQAVHYPASRRKQVAQDPGASKQGNLTGPRQIDSGKATGISRRLVTHSTQSRPITMAILNGQPFHNAHTRSSKPASVGGPSNSKSTTAISGTDLNRKLR